MSAAKKRRDSLALPPVDLRSIVGSPVRWQGSRPLCVPISVAAAHEAARAKAVGTDAPELCIEPLWGHCVASGRTSAEGTWLDAVGDALTSDGHTFESVWPYNETLAEHTEARPAGADQADWFTADLVAVPVAHDGIESMIEAALSAELAVVLLIEMTAEFDPTGPGGEISVPPIQSPAGAYHAVVAVGAATNSAGDTRRLLIRNSWGTRWGAGGYGWLPYDYLIGFCPQAAVIDPSTLRTCRKGPHGTV